ncbi:hypothetical protein FHR56_001702 [Xanthomonas sacchari]|nr:hypothetical protein [Xanthomonas sp. F10]
MKPWRLHTRIAALLVLVVLAAQALTFLAVHVATQRSVAAQLDDELRTGERVWQRIDQRRDEQLLQAASVLADDFGFRAAVTSGDVPTMQSALRNHAARVRAPSALLLSADGQSWQGCRRCRRRSNCVRCSRCCGRRSATAARSASCCWTGA